jgi:hypothetical protein
MVLVYTALSYILKPTPSVSLNELRILFWIFCLVGALDFGLGIYLEQRLARRPANVNTSASPSSRLLTVVIVSVAFAISIVIYGFILFLLGDTRAHFWPFMAASFFYIILLNNRLDGLAQAVSESHPAE